MAEDSPPARRFTSRVLEDGGYRVTQACNGAEALERLHASADAIDALVTDVAMPAMGGVELVRLCAERIPDLPVVFVSAYAEPGLADEGLRATRSGWLRKPFSSDELLASVRRLLDGEEGAGA